MNYQNLTFGTAGIRGIMGDGDGELNLDAIAAISHSLAKVFAEDYKEGSVIFCYDSRKNGKDFALLAAKIIGSYGFSVYITSEPAPTPFLSYAVKKMNAIGGVNITASHNPKEYNGYKAYAKGGAQIDVAFAQRVQAYLKTMTLSPLTTEIKPSLIPQEIYEEYLDTIMENLALTTTDFGTFFGCYTPLCGSAGNLMRRLTAKAHLPFVFVESQMAPDGEFPNLPTPNPDNRAVFATALQNGDAPLLLANDPDGDRLGAMVKTEKGYEMLSGNDIGVLLLQYLLDTTEDVCDKYIVKSLVSTSFAETIAKSRGVITKNVPVGFRYIAQKIAQDEKNFLFGFEESGGYLAHPHAGDKDGIEGACLLLKAGAYYQKKGKTLLDVLDDLFTTYGKVENTTITLDMPLSVSKETMVALRKNPPQFLGEEKITVFTDYAPRDDELKGNLLGFSTESTDILLRPSGTEPKMKVYATLTPKSGAVEKNIKKLFEECEERIFS